MAQGNNRSNNPGRGSPDRTRRNPQGNEGVYDDIEVDNSKLPPFTVLLLYILAPLPWDMEILGLIAAYGGPLAPIAKKHPYIEPIYISNLTGFQKIVLALLVGEVVLELGFTGMSAGIGYFAGGLIPLDSEWLLMLAKIARKLHIFKGTVGKWAYRGHMAAALTGSTPHHEMGEGRDTQEVNNSGQRGRPMTDGGVNRGSADNSGSLLGFSSRTVKLLIFGSVIIGLLVLGVLVMDSGYVDYAANEAGFQAAQMQFDAPVNAFREAGKTIECFGNVACMRKWRMNNTQRPGSEEVGQEYSLMIENYEVNDGFPLDVANRQPDDRVPVGFSVYNPRHGLKGVTARNVAYRVRIYDSQGSITGGEPECQTGWKPLGGQYTGSDFDGNGTILPGSFATPLGTHSDLTLRNCGLLQPALGLNRIVKLQVAYDYSSQSTLYVDAMSRENMLSLDERPSFKKSETADTPVKTYVNVESPITYRVDDETDEAESSIFGVRLGFETGQRNVKYRIDVEDFKFYDSSKTVDIENALGTTGSAACEDLRRESGDQYTFSDEMAELLEQRQDGSWFESNAGPSPARCSMVLENPESISPTGETLTMRVDANYTVMLEKQVTGFKAQNSRCSSVTIECPMLVPESKKSASTGQSSGELGDLAQQAVSGEDTEESGDEGSGSEEPPLISECDSSKRIDANDGCGARLGEDWPSVAADYAINDDVDAIIEKGETAYLWSNLVSKLPGYSDSYSDTVVGLKPETLERLGSGGSEKYGALAAVEGQRGADLEYRQLDLVLCSDYSKQEFRNLWADENNYERVPYFNVYTTGCGKNTWEDKVFGWMYDTPKEKYSEAQSSCDSVVMFTGSGYRCYP